MAKSSFNSKDVLRESLQDFYNTFLKTLSVGECITVHAEKISNATGSFAFINGKMKEKKEIRHTASDDSSSFKGQ